MDNGPWNIRQWKVRQSFISRINLSSNWTQAAYKQLNTTITSCLMCCQILTGFLLELNLENMLLCCYTWRLSMLSSKDFHSVSSNMNHIKWLMNKKPFPWHCFWFHVSYNRKLFRILFENPSKILPIFLIIFQVFWS